MQNGTVIQYGDQNTETLPKVHFLSDLAEFAVYDAEHNASLS